MRWWLIVFLKPSAAAGCFLFCLISNNHSNLLVVLNHRIRMMKYHVDEYHFDDEALYGSSRRANLAASSVFDEAATRRVQTWQVRA
jgi:hypothetical protein